MMRHSGGEGVAILVQMMSRVEKGIESARYVK